MWGAAPQSLPCSGLRVTPSPTRASTAALTALTLVAFASNSLLCREALRATATDPLLFTALRLLSGAALLLPLARALDPPREPAARAGSLGSAVALVAYAVCFSLAYMRLEAGTGALVLFGAVQASMLLAGLRAGERPGAAQWAGLLAALGGLAWLLLPGLSAPDPAGVGLMALAGVAWGVYSLRGRGAARPIATTAGNFLRAAPLGLAALALAPLLGTPLAADRRGALLALASGGLASGLGYSLWYRALRGHTATTAAISQLAVPVLAAAGGALLLGERPGARLLGAGALVLSGVALATLAPRRRPA